MLATTRQRVLNFYFSSLPTHPHPPLSPPLPSPPLQWAFISEEVAAQRTSLRDVASKAADVVAARAAAGKNYGVILLPEGLVEYAHDFATLIHEINAIMVEGVDAHDLDAVAAAMTPESREVFAALSVGFQREFLEDRDPHGNVQVMAGGVVLVEGC